MIRHDRRMHATFDFVDQIVVLVRDRRNEHLAAMADECLEVSPATHPPCNADNPCQMIWDEIARGCKMLGNDAPAYCSDY